jgi:hypothetical protein
MKSKIIFLVLPICILFAYSCSLTSRMIFDNSPKEIISHDFMFLLWGLILVLIGPIIWKNKGEGKIGFSLMKISILCILIGLFLILSVVWSHIIYPK